MKNLPAHSVGRSGQLCFQLLIVAFALVVGVCSKDVGARDLRSTDSSSTKSDRPAFAQGDTLVNDRCVPFPSAYAIQQTGNLDAHFDSYGRFGLAWGGYLPNGIWPEASFQTPSEYDIEYLFAGSFWIGGRIGNDTLVSAGIDGWQVAQEMWPPMSNGTYTNNIRPFSSIADRSYWSETTDTGLTGQYPMDVVLNRLHRPFPISIVNRSHVWRTDRTKDIIVYDMLLRNEGSSIIEDGYLGFYFDADAGHLTTSGYYSDDLSGSIRSDGIAYIIDNDGDPVGGQFVETTSPTKTFAFKLLESSVPLADTSFHWWLSNANSQDDFGPTRVDSLGNPIHCDFPTGGSGTPDGDLSKYCLLSSGEWDYDMIYVGREDEQDSLWMAPPPGLNLNWLDAKFLISFGPFTLPPDSVIRFVFSTFSADSVHVDPYNLSRLSVHPDSFKAYLNFDNMISNANVADSLA